LDEEEYGEFPDLGWGMIKSFDRISKCLEELNLAVPKSEYVSDAPVILNIHSPNVPNLSLIDLPGYIQVTTKDQPVGLKEKISDICEKYIQEPNLILAISAADVDLANSDALRAAKIVDPNGVRTIGVLTKMDLVSPEIGVNLLETKDYELPLGFIGVVCAPDINQTETEYFNSNSEYSNALVGVHRLRNCLSSLLEKHLSKSLSITKKIVQKEIYDTEYQLKAKYNNQTTHSYMLSALDSLKFKFQSFALSIRNTDIRERIDSFLSEKVSEICRKALWVEGKTKISSIQQELDSLTKAGIGKVSVDTIHSFVLEEIKEIANQDPWNHHTISQEIIIDISRNLLEAEAGNLINQIEAMIQPLKTPIEFNATEWMIGKKITSSLLKQEIQKVRHELAETVGKIPSSTQLRKAMRQISKTEFDYQDVFLKQENGSEYSIEVIEVAQKALELEEYLYHLLNRDYSVFKSCSSAHDCLDIYLSLIADRLTSTASLFISHSLLTRVFNDLPRSLETHFSNMSEDELLEFVKENPDMHHWLDLNRKRSILQQTLVKMNEIEVGTQV
jgi:hypothetical protein